MYVYEKYDFSLFESRFVDYNRADQFSGEGLRALFNYLEELAESTGTPVEIDVIGLCCEFSEDSLETVLEESGLNDIEDLEDATWVEDLGNGYILYQVF